MIDHDAHVIDLATTAWCWARLLTANEGVLSSKRERQAAGFEVGYSVDDGQVRIPTRSFRSAARLLVDSEVTLGLAGHDEDGRRWAVRATGTASLPVLAVDSLAACRSSHPAGAASADLGALLVTVDRLRGYYETPLVVPEPR